jgi:serine/threonine-protein kinase
VVTAEEARSALERILASDDFVHAGRMSGLLRFVVEKTLAGGCGEIKEYLLGVEVFGRDSSFDPRLDPVVRVEARRLRGKLNEYYAGRGAGDAVRIVLRKGSYVPQFEPKPEPEPASRSRSAALWALVAALGVVLAGVLLFSPGVAGRHPRVPIAVVLQANSRQPFAGGLGEAVSIELSRQAGLQVAAWPRVERYLAQEGETRAGQIARDLNVKVLLFLSVQESGGRIRTGAHLIDPVSGWKSWAGDYERGSGEPFAIQRELARAIGEEVAAQLRERNR